MKTSILGQLSGVVSEKSSTIADMNQRASSGLCQRRLRPNARCASLLLLLLCPAALPAIAQQVDPITVIKNQIDERLAMQRKVDGMFLVKVLKEQTDAMNGAEEYLRSIGFPYVDDPDDHQLERASAFAVKLDHQKRQMELERLRDALVKAQAGLPLPTTPTEQERLPFFLTLMGVQLAKENEQGAEDARRTTEIIELEQIVGMCISSQYVPTTTERQKLKELADLLDQGSRENPDSPLSPGEQQRVKDLTASIAPKWQSLTRALQQAEAAREAEVARQAALKAAEEAAAKARAAEEARKRAQHHGSDPFNDGFHPNSQPQPHPTPSNQQNKPTPQPPDHHQQPNLPGPKSITPT